MKDYTKFLKEVESLNKKYASIYFNVELEALAMPFWSWEEIQKGLELRQEWENEWQNEWQVVQLVGGDI